MDLIAASDLRPCRYRLIVAAVVTTASRAMLVAILCCLMPVTTYSALEARVSDEADRMLFVGLKLRLPEATFPLGLVV